jgi:hypothetical protein
VVSDCIISIYACISGWSDKRECSNWSQDTPRKESVLKDSAYSWHFASDTRAYSAFQLSEKTINLSEPKNRQRQRYEKPFSSSFKCKPL